MTAPVVTGLTAQYSTLAMTLRIALLDYWDCCDEIIEQKEIAIESCESPYAQRLGLVILSAAVCEGAINAYLSLKMSASEFKAIDRKPTPKKWTTVITGFYSEYSITNELLLDLKLLFECRHSIMHSKPQVFSGQSPVHEGNVEAWKKIDENAIERFFSLTPRLLENLCNYDRDVPLGAQTILSSVRMELALPTREVYRRIRAQRMRDAIQEAGKQSR